MKKEEQKLIANEFTNVKTIKNNLLYSKDDYIFGYIRIYPANFELLTEAENEGICNNLVSTFKGDTQDFVYFTLPREVDIDSYKNYLEKKYMSELVSRKRKFLLNDMITHAVEMSSNHENFEHQHFIKLWREYKDGYQEEQELRSKLLDFKQRYSAIKVRTEILEDIEIMKVCNLFANGVQAAHESIDSLYYTPHTTLKK